MSQYLTDAAYNELHHLLASVNLMEDDIYTICKDATLDRSLVAFTGVTFNTWDSALSRAEIEGKVLQLIDSVINFKDGNTGLETFKEKLQTGDLWEPSETAAWNGMIINPGAPIMLMMFDRADRDHCKELKKHFYIFESNGELNVKAFPSLTEMKDEEQRRALVEEATIIMPVVSPDFFNEGNRFMPHLRMADENNKKIIPVLLRKCSYAKIAVLKSYSTLPPHKKFINEYTDAELGYAHVAEGIDRFLSKK